MNKIEKAIQKFSKKERLWIREVIERVVSKKTIGLNIKKIKGKDDAFRVRKGDIRIIYRLDRNGEVIITTISRRNEET